MRSARCAIDVDGLVQGVGFRPFVHGLAGRHGLGGFVRNGPFGVHIEVEGDESAITEFVDELRVGAPALATVEHIVCRSAPLKGDPRFRIEPSEVGSEGRFVVPADVATCRDCLSELFGENDRRRGHPFINCTGCGPRASIVTELPYDRERTTMSAFELCAACQAEYECPTDRRFHAQPIACPECGPRLSLRSATGGRVPGDALAEFATTIRRGGVGALKGIGGFHLVCDATNETAVAELRRRKNRERKPFAVMVGGLAAAERIVVLDELSRRALTSAAAPIVVAPCREPSSISVEVAPGTGTLGVMLPYAPLHHLLLARLDGRALVVTSGNVSEEPIACTDAQALAQLGSVADLFLTHDRPIELRMEDSVVRTTGNAIIPIRRSRGYAPLPIDLPFAVETPTLAVGGHDKAVFCMGFERRAVLSPHFGNLESYAAHSAFGRAVEHFERLFRIHPTCVVHDFHPDYATTEYALDRSQAGAFSERVAVQHHHAHLASVMAENGLDGDVIGVCFDGAGYGTQGGSWGGEFLVGGYRAVERAAHVAEVDLPGGDRAARQPWRSALGHLRAAGLSSRAADLLPHVEKGSLRALQRMMDRGAACEKTSSVGRLFDAVAALANVCAASTYEGEAGMRLEALAERSEPSGAYPVELVDVIRSSRRSRSPEGARPFVVDPAPLVFGVVRDVAHLVPSTVIARRFHSAVVELVALACERIRAERGIDRVALSGGVFQNAILSREIPIRLEAGGFSVFQHHVVPPNDGGLALGQLAVAAHRPPIGPGTRENGAS